MKSRFDWLSDFGDTRFNKTVNLKGFPFVTIVNLRTSSPFVTSVTEDNWCNPSYFTVSTWITLYYLQIYDILHGALRLIEKIFK